jgi:hypothetical protein
MKPAPLLLLVLVPLALAPLGFSATPLQLPSSAHVWRQSQRTDTASGTASTRFTLVGKFLKSPEGDISNRPAMVVDCIPGKASDHTKGRFVAASLLIGINLKIEYVEPEEIHGTSYYPKVSVRYRINDTKDEEEKWSPGTDKTSVSIPKDSLKKILRAQTVDTTANDEHGSQIVMKFDLPDPASVEAACNVDEREK